FKLELLVTGASRGLAPSPLSGGRVDDHLGRVVLAVRVEDEGRAVVGPGHDATRRVGDDPVDAQLEREADLQVRLGPHRQGAGVVADGRVVAGRPGVTAGVGHERGSGALREVEVDHGDRVAGADVADPGRAAVDEAEGGGDGVAGRTAYL